MYTVQCVWLKTLFWWCVCFYFVLPLQHIAVKNYSEGVRFVTQKSQTFCCILRSYFMLHLWNWNPWQLENGIMSWVSRRLNAVCEEILIKQVEKNSDFCFACLIYLLCKCLVAPIFHAVNFNKNFMFWTLHTSFG